MTTFTIQGTRVYFDNQGNSRRLETGEIQLVAPSKSSTFSYSVTGFYEGVPQINIDSDAIEVLIDGTPLATLEQSGTVQALIAEVDWSGGTSIVLGFNIAPDGENGSEIYFHLDGPMIDISNVDDWEEFNDSITAIRTPGGNFAPGADIKYSAFSDHTRTEDDEFFGTSDDDILTGGVGDDYFNSSEGNDRFIGGAGAYDQVSYAFDPDGVDVDLSAQAGTDGFGDSDTLRSIEMVRGSAYADTITGDRNDNQIRGLAGDDTLDGGRGTDRIRYDRDARYGGEDGVIVNFKKGFAIDGFGDRDTLMRFERAQGSESRDKFIGSGKGEEFEGLGGNDVINSGGGEDTVYGGGGRDKINAGGGDDILTGNGGADRFIFKGNFGDDVITDFSTRLGKEKIDLSAIQEITSFQDLTADHLEQNADGDAVIQDDDGNSITLEGVSISDLSGSDFLF